MLTISGDGGVRSPALLADLRASSGVLIGPMRGSPESLMAALREPFTYYIYWLLRYGNQNSSLQAGDD